MEAAEYRIATHLGMARESNYICGLVVHVIADKGTTAVRAITHGGMTPGGRGPPGLHSAVGYSEQQWTVRTA